VGPGIVTNNNVQPTYNKGLSIRSIGAGIGKNLVKLASAFDSELGVHYSNSNPVEREAK